MTETEKLYQLSEGAYTKATERCSSFNAKFLTERRVRLPYLDSQTGVAQNASDLWKKRYMRLPGKYPRQLYSYPEKRWRRPKKVERIVDIKPPSPEQPAVESELTTLLSSEPAIVAPRVDSEDTNTSAAATSVADASQWYEDYENISEPPDAGEVDNLSEGSDFEDYMRGRKQQKKKPKGRAGARGGGRRKRQQEPKDAEEGDDVTKPYACQGKTPSRPKAKRMCGVRYKTRPGLSYHMTHSHPEEVDDVEEPEQPPPPTENKKKKRAPGERAPPNSYCDFCLGDTDKNKDGAHEELCGCADCGRAGHPTCLQFTPNMCISVKKYPWQCIECKSCGLCGTSDNDDQLLFCDDCDRGYHMYCLKPPLTEPPEGNWSCHLCIVEFHGGVQPASIPQD